MPIGDHHTDRSYDEALRKLDDALIRMTALAESQLNDCLAALSQRDSALATKVIDGDAEIDDLEHFVSEQAVRLLVLRAPVADDLRMVVTALKVAGDLERIADHAANTARRSLVLNQFPAIAPVRPLLRLGEAVQDLLRATMDAYMTGDAEQALAARDRDQEVDARYSSLFREILTYMMEDPRTITLGSHLMFIAKNIERVGDHATNIAEMTYYRVTGRTLGGTRPKGDVSSREGAAVEAGGEN